MKLPESTASCRRPGSSWSRRTVSVRGSIVVSVDRSGVGHRRPAAVSADPPEPPPWCGSPDAGRSSAEQPGDRPHRQTDIAEDTEPDRLSGTERGWIVVDLGQRDVGTEHPAVPGRPSRQAAAPGHHHIGTGHQLRGQPRRESAADARGRTLRRRRSPPRRPTSPAGHRPGRPAPPAPGRVSAHRGRPGRPGARRAGSGRPGPQPGRDRRPIVGRAAAGPTGRDRRCRPPGCPEAG